MTVVAIVGGAGDIGSACAARLALAGHQVVIGDRKPSAADLPPAVDQRLADAEDRDSIQSFVDDIVSRYGRLDTLACAQGIVRNEDLVDITPEAWDATLSVNLTSAKTCAQVAAQAMLAQSPGRDGLRGRVVFIGSWVSTSPWPGFSAYTVTKAGLRTLASAIALELGPQQITSNVLEPGIVDAGLSAALMVTDPEFRRRALAAILLGRLQSLESVAGALDFLCSDASAYMTGTNLRVDGGATLQRGR